MWFFSCFRFIEGATQRRNMVTPNCYTVGMTQGWFEKSQKAKIRTYFGTKSMLIVSFTVTKMGINLINTYIQILKVNSTIVEIVFSRLEIIIRQLKYIFTATKF